MTTILHRSGRSLRPQFRCGHSTKQTCDVTGAVGPIDRILHSCALYAGHAGPHICPCRYEWEP